MLMKKPNKVRAKLRRGQPVVGTAIYSFSPNIVEAAGYSGIDFLRIDTEHAWRRDESLEHMLRAAAVADVVPIVRIDREDPYLIRKALEVGAGGVLVPQVNTARETAEIVRAAKYPPRGTRGFASLSVSAAWGAREAAEYREWSDTEPLVGVMIEDVAAMDEIDAILAIDGLDFVLFGPADYSFSLGLGAPARSHPKLLEGLTRTIEAARKAGKGMMYGIGADRDEMAKALAMGVNMLELAHDVAIVRTTLQACVKAMPAEV